MLQRSSSDIPTATFSSWGCWAAKCTTLKETPAKLMKADIGMLSPTAATRISRHRQRHLLTRTLEFLRDSHRSLQTCLSPRACRSSPVWAWWIGATGSPASSARRFLKATQICSSCPLQCTAQTSTRARNTRLCSSAPGPVIRNAAVVVASHLVKGYALAGTTHRKPGQPCDVTRPEAAETIGDVESAVTPILGRAID